MQCRSVWRDVFCWLRGHNHLHVRLFFCILASLQISGCSGHEIRQFAENVQQRAESFSAEQAMKASQAYPAEVLEGTPTVVASKEPASAETQNQATADENAQGQRVILLYPSPPAVGADVAR